MCFGCDSEYLEILICVQTQAEGTGMVVEWQLISDEEASAAQLMMQVVAYAETVRLVARAREAGTSVDTLNDAMRKLGQLGVGRQVRPVEVPPTPSDVSRASQALITALEDSPLPQIEWGPMADILSDDALARLLGISESSLARYRSGERTTPDSVAARLHFVTLIVADLLGSYNDLGVRLWFRRPRTALGGLAPTELLTGEWSPDSANARNVRRLARSLLGAAVG